MANAVVTRTGALELHKQLGQRMIDEAVSNKITLSQLLEENDPSEKGDELSAFDRQLEVADIVTTTDRREGYQADLFREFEKTEQSRILQAEWIDRQYRAVGEMDLMNRVIGSDFSGIEPKMRPYLIQAAQNAQIQPAVPLSSVIAFTTTIDNDSYRALYVTSEPSEFKKVRVGQGAPIPEARLDLGEKSINLYKFGRAMVVTYEALRRVPIDTVATYIQLAAIQAEMDKVSTVLDVMLNGDGNANTAATVVDLTDLDGDATAPNLTLKAWAKFKLSFRQPYSLNTELVQEDVLIQQLFLSTGSTSALLFQFPNSGLGGFTAINPNLSTSVAAGVLAEAPANRIIGFDRNFAVQRVIEAGSNISESMRWIRNQTTEMTFSENEGYAVVQPKAIKVLNLTA